MSFISKLNHIKEERNMSEQKNLPVSELHLDLDNFRTIHQDDEVQAINTMISMSDDHFYALLESLLDDGYLPTETIIVLHDGKYIVKEGNRRIAALKIIFGLIQGVDITSTLQEKIKDLTPEWKKKNSEVPCLIFNKNESQQVDRIVSLVHAKGEKAGRDPWNAVATARYNRDKKNNPEPALDLLEKYLDDGKNLSSSDKERWSGEYPLSILVETISKLSSTLKCNTVAEFVKNYPKQNKKSLDDIMYDIGVGHLTFKIIRDKSKFFGSKYGVPSTPAPTTTKTPSKPVAYASNDPKSVFEKLNQFTPRGKGREKLVTLIDEMRRLKLEKHPHSFCFLLRSSFEISAKAFCEDHKTCGGPTQIKSDGKDKSLTVILREITEYITKGNSDKQKVKELHGAMTELGKNEGILSVTSMNQLVHNPKFSVSANDISTVFNNIYPLLEEMNR